MDDSSTLRSIRSGDEKKAQMKAEVLPNNSSQQTVTVTNVPPAQPDRRNIDGKKLARARKIYLWVTFTGMLMLTFIIFGVFPIYWGSLYRAQTNTHKLVGWVVDFDHGAVGNAITTAVKHIPYAPTTMTWVVKDASEFPGGPADLAHSVHDQDVWFAVSVNPGTSDAINAALADPQQHKDYTGINAVTAYGEEGRNENAFRGFTRPQFEAMMQPIAARFAADFASHNFSALSQEQQASVVQNAPQVVNRPVYYSIDNMHPFDLPVAAAVVFIGMIYLIILAFVAGMVSFGAREMSGYGRSLPVRQLVALRIVTDIILYFFLSLFYSLLNLAFQTKFNRYFTNGGGFMAYWMLQWMGMLAVGFAVETMITFLTPRFFPLFLLFWVVVNVSVAQMPIDVLPNVYRYGYASPFYNIGQGIRTIIFGTKNHLGQNFGILFAWIAISCITLPLSTMYARWSNLRRAAKAHAKQAEELAIEESAVEADEEAQHMQAVRSRD